MRIKIKPGFCAAGPGVSLAPGHEYEVSDAQGRAYIEAGAAVEVKAAQKPQAPVAPPIETAERRDRDEAEEAVSRRGRGRPRGARE